MKQVINLFILVLSISSISIGIANAQDLVPPKTSEHSEITTIEHGKYPDLKLTPDKPEVVTLERDVANIIVGNTEHLAVTPDSARRIVLIPRQPGATFLRVLAEDGSTIMERHVVIAAPKKKDNYVRIRRSCINGEEGCQEYSMYYCPDMCHKLGIAAPEAIQQATQANPTGDPTSQNQQPPALEPADGVPNTTR